jgi:Flp pilus assembly protein TadB
VLAADRVEDRVTDSTKPDSDSPDNDERVEQLARELAERLRAMPNRQELTDYAVSLLKESNEDAGQSEQAAAMIARAGKNDPFNPFAFAIPLFVIGAVLCATGILAGVGLGVIGIALLMILWGLVVSLFSRRPRPQAKQGPEG